MIAETGESRDVLRRGWSVAMECRRHLEGDADLACEAIGRIKIGDRRSWPTAESIRTFLSAREHVLIVAAEDGEPIGFAVAYLPDRIDENHRMALFYEIEVAEAHRCRGVGRAMIEILKPICGAEGVAKMWVQTTPPDEAAAALYRSTGARAAGSDGELVFTYHFAGPGDEPTVGEPGCRLGSE